MLATIIIPLICLAGFVFVLVRMERNHDAKVEEYTRLYMPHAHGTQEDI